MTIDPLFPESDLSELENFNKKELIETIKTTIALANNFTRLMHSHLIDRGRILVLLEEKIKNLELNKTWQSERLRAQTKKIHQLEQQLKNNTDKELN